MQAMLMQHKKKKDAEVCGGQGTRLWRRTQIDNCNFYSAIAPSPINWDFFLSSFFLFLSLFWLLSTGMSSLLYNDSIEALGSMYTIVQDSTR